MGHQHTYQKKMKKWAKNIRFYNNYNFSFYVSYGLFFKKYLVLSFYIAKSTFLSTGLDTELDIFNSLTFVISFCLSEEKNEIRQLTFFSLYCKHSLYFCCYFGTHNPHYTINGLHKWFF